MKTSEKLEEYRIFIEDTARFSDRRQMASNVLVAVNSALVAGAAVLFAEDSIEQPWSLLLALALLAAGIVVSHIWRQLITRYKEMIGFRCQQLQEIEQQIDGSHRMMCKLRCQFPDQSFSDMEAKLPCVFIALYCVLILGLLVAFCLHSREVTAQICELVCLN